MTPHSISTNNRENALSQYVVIERHPRGLYAKISCPTIGQREAPVIAAEIGEAILNMNLPRGSSLVMDMSNVTMLMSMGLGVCIDVKRQADAAKLKPYLFGTSRALLDLLRMMKIDRQYTIVHGKDELGSILG
jgi:anti-anti-sigma regulatory factor